MVMALLAESTDDAGLYMARDKECVYEREREGDFTQPGLSQVETRNLEFHLSLQHERTIQILGPTFFIVY